MRILAIETATPIGSAALLLDDGVVAEAESPEPMRHLEWLLPAIERMLDMAGWHVADVEGIAVSRGPGSFTGLRVGMATAAAWARTRGIPVVGVSTLEAIASGLHTAGTICVMRDARRGEYASAVFARSDSRLRRLSDDLVGNLSTVLVSVPPEGPVIFAGDVLERDWLQILDRFRSRAVPAPPEGSMPRAREVGRLGLCRLAAGESDDPYLLLPAYTRAPVRE